MTLDLYRLDGLWHFDDASKGVCQEPFVPSATDAIDALIGVPCDRARLEFSAEPFGGAAQAFFVCREGEGVIYNVAGNDAWLCPVFFLYFQEPPQEIWVKAWSETMTNREIAKQLGWIINPKEAENAIAKALDDAEARVEAKYANCICPHCNKRYNEEAPAMLEHPGACHQE